MAFRYELRFTDGEDAGTFETNLSDFKPGDEFIGDGNVQLRIVSMIPGPRIGEFVDTHGVEGLWMVEPL